MLLFVFGLLSLPQTIFIEYLLCARHYSQTRDTRDKNPCLMEFMSWGETDNKLINV